VTAKLTTRYKSLRRLLGIPPRTRPPNQVQNDAMPASSRRRSLKSGDLRAGQRDRRKPYDRANRLKRAKLMTM